MSHELRTPLLSIKLILEQIIIILSALNDSSTTNLALEQVIRYANLVVSQLNLMESFVEDLLNLRLLREGIFTIAYDRFDPTELYSSPTIRAG